jgi:tRNA threonylcarbamoyladenosine biosynthesis protein TsaB
VRVLAIETAMTACSVALFDGATLLASDAAIAGRGAVERLIPMIAALPDGGRADILRVDCGPGSFTGIRTGLAAARALGFGWGATVQGYSSLALIAATWFADHDEATATVVIDGGHGEVFTQSYDQHPFTAHDALQSVPITAFRPGSYRLIGNAAHRFGASDATGPDAREIWRLTPPFLAPVALYGRGADAKPMA